MFLEKLDGSLWRTDWAWKPDKEVRLAIARGNRKWHKFGKSRSKDYLEMRRLQRKAQADELERLRHEERIMLEIMSGLSDSSEEN